MSTAKIIIATYGFPPYLRSLGGAIRVLKLAEYLSDQGLEPTVVCARTPHFDTFGYDEVLARIRTIACDDPVAKLASRVSAPQGGTSTPGRSGLLGRLRLWLKAQVLDVMVPDTGILVARAMHAAIQKEIASADGPVTLITSGPPHSVHLVGWRLSRTTPDLNWIMDYRDSWNGTSLFRKRNRLLQQLNESLERRCLRACRHLTYISGPMLAKAETIAGCALAAKATLISNGYDEALLRNVQQQSAAASPRPDAERLRIGYYGALDHGPASYRDPAVIYRALMQFPAEAVQFVVHGPSALQDDWIDRLGARVRHGGKLSHADAIRSMFDMDALVLLHTRDEGADEVVTGKVFEYVATGRPIISIGPAEMAVNTLLRDDPSFHWVDHRDEAGLVRLLHALQASRRAGASQRAEPLIRSFSRTEQHQKFLHLMASRG